MKVKYYLARPDSQETGIVITLRSGEKTIRVGAGITVNPDHWNTEKGRLRQNYSAASEINTLLDNLSVSAQKYFAYAQTQNIPEPLRYTQQQLIANDLPREKPAPPVVEVAPSAVPMLLECYRQFIESKKADKLAPASVKVLKTTLTHLAKVFSETTTLAEFCRKSETDKDKTPAKKWQKYLYEHFTDNSHAKHLRVVKRFLFWCIERDLITGINPTKLFSTAGIEKAASSFALTAAEVKAIEATMFPARPEIESVRLLFLLQCYSGLRISDALRVRPHHVRGNALTIDIVKTREPHHVPITPPLHRVLTAMFDAIKTGAFIAPKFTQQVNDYLKVIGKDAGLTDELEIVRYKGNTAITEVRKKYEVLTTHVGRRSFITESLRRGIGERLVMKASGHTDEKSFRKYVKLSARDVENAYTEKWQ